LYALTFGTPHSRPTPSIDSSSVIGENAGFAFPVHAHTLRHASGYALANAGDDTRRIQDWLGHDPLHAIERRAVQGFLAVEGLRGEGVRALANRRGYPLRTRLANFEVVDLGSGADDQKPPQVARGLLFYGNQILVAFLRLYQDTVTVTSITLRSHMIQMGQDTRAR
jgi:hypothetical protein